MAHKTPKWQKRLEIIVSLPAYVLDFIISFTWDYALAVLDGEKKELPQIKKVKSKKVDKNQKVQLVLKHEKV